MEERHVEGRRSHFSLTAPWALAMALLVATIVWWSAAAADPDFWLPNPWGWLTLWVVTVFVVSGSVRSDLLRSNLRLGLAIIPVVLIIVMEVRLERRDVGSMQGSIEEVSDPLLRYRYRPGASRGIGNPPVNSHGLLDIEHAIPKPQGTYRVVLLGDSVPNDGAIPFADRFPSRLEALLSAAAPAGLAVDVVNVSCEGYNTQQEVELYEEVGRSHGPDVVVLTYVLNDPFLQNGGYRRIGSSFFLFFAAPLVRSVMGANDCGLYAPMHQGYGYALTVTSGFRRLRALTDRDGVPVIVAALPLMADFDDPICADLYDQVEATARSEGFAFLRVADAFRGENYRDYLKKGRERDTTHPNAAGHARIAEFLARALRERIVAASSSPALRAH